MIMMMRTLALAALMLFNVLGHAVQAADTSIPPGIFLTRQAGDQQLARDFLVGAKVYNGENKIIGDIEDLILDEVNRVEGVIVGVGGVLGLGEKRIGVKYTALQIEIRDDKPVIVLPQATPAVLKALAPYQRTAPPRSFFELAMDKAKELASKTSDTTKDAYLKAKEKVGPAYEAAKQKAGEAYQAAKEKVKETVEKAKQPAQ